MNKTGKIYFASDLHLGLPNHKESRKREDLFVRWLDLVKQDAQEIFLLGDIFDFWYEYKRVVPKGFVRLLGKLAEICDSGIPVHFFTGNHDLWAKDYLPKEVGVALYTSPQEFEFSGKKFFIAHGDGLGPGDRSFKILKSIFTSPLAQWFFSRIHPNFSLWLGSSWSQSRQSFYREEKFYGLEREWLYLFAKNKLKEKHFDYFVFGHRHLKLDLEVGKKGRYINLGDWLKLNSYAVFDGNTMKTKQFNGKNLD